MPASTPFDPSEVPVDLHANARRVGGYAWLSTRLFEVVGGWVQTTASPVEVKLSFAELAPQYAWHAQLWRARLPELRELTRDEFVLPSPGSSAAIEALAALDEPLARLAGLARGLLPRLVVSLEELSSGLHPVTDAPLARCVRLVRRDHVDAVHAAARLHARFVRDEHTLQRVAEGTGAVEGAIVRARAASVDEVL